MPTLLDPVMNRETTMWIQTVTGTNLL